MQLKSVTLNDNIYHEYLSGKEIACDATHINNKNISEGEHVMVYKDTVAANSDAPAPKREIQSDYIGIEGVVTTIEKHRGEYENTPDVTQRFFIKKI